MILNFESRCRSYRSSFIKRYCVRENAGEGSQVCGCQARSLEELLGLDAGTDERKGKPEVILIGLDMIIPVGEGM